jgi:hypothetical protein
MVNLHTNMSRQSSLNTTSEGGKKIESWLRLIRYKENATAYEALDEVDRKCLTLLIVDQGPTSIINIIRIGVPSAQMERTMGRVRATIGFKLE